jgi:hypothetical protein
MTSTNAHDCAASACELLAGVSEETCRVADLAVNAARNVANAGQLAITATNLLSVSASRAAATSEAVAAVSEAADAAASTAVTAAALSLVLRRQQAHLLRLITVVERADA